MHPVSSFTTPVDDLYVGQGTQHGGNKSRHQSPVPNRGYVENPKPQSTPPQHGEYMENLETIQHTYMFGVRSTVFHFGVRYTIISAFALLY